MTEQDQITETTWSFAGAKILMYSHDTYGLGHLRRCREIAHALVEAYSGVSVLIISGATIAGAFDYRSRVDFVKVPSVIKLRNGDYTSLAQHIPLADTLAMRRSIIRQTAEAFDPDIFIVDKEPVGLRGEIEETLEMLCRRGARLVLGLREVMDAPRLLAAEWKEAGRLEQIQRYYDAIWVYGPEGFNDPLKGLDVPAQVRQLMRYTGFLRRRAREVAPERLSGEGFDRYIVVTAGGGGDGQEVIRQVLEAYRLHGEGLPSALVNLGPYMLSKDREELKVLAEPLGRVQIIDFDNRLEDFIAGSSGVVAMAGYNTFCEILSFDKPSLLLPRTMPREEQLIRAQRASALGLASMLLPEQSANPDILARALRELPHRPCPSTADTVRADLDGLNRIVADVGEWLKAARQPNANRAHG